jgi:hypothetical protein
MRVITSTEIAAVSGAGVTITQDGGVVMDGLYDGHTEPYGDGGIYANGHDDAGFWEVYQDGNGNVDVWFNGDLVDSYIA